MTKILFCDMDGTLYNHDSIFDIKDFEAIKEFRKQGHIVALCTGRNKLGVNRLGESHPVEYDYMCLCNGAQILDPNGDMYFEKSIPAHIGNEIVRKYYSKEMSVFCSQGDKNFSCQNDVVSEITKNGFNEVNISLETQLNQAPHYFLIAFNELNNDFDHVLEVGKEIIEQYGEYVEIFPNKNDQFCCIDIVPKDCSKGQSIERLIDLANLEIDGIYAIGDSYNDISMLQKADQGYSFTRADEAVKQHGKIVDYVYEAIEDILK